MATLCLFSTYAQDAEVTNYKSGISLNFSGTRGIDFAEEYFYHDKLICDRKVVYIRDTTKITMSHNERNQVGKLKGVNDQPIVGIDGLDGLPNSGDEGIIRYKIDGDMSWGPQWASQYSTRPLNPAYTGPISFASLRYPTGIAGGFPVVGKTGDNGAPYSPKADHFEFGQLDSFGDEWHQIQVADDDWEATAAGDEWRASDGKVFLFVVNPKTPCLTWRTTGNAQFYTTPPKMYFVPKIHNQTTYIEPGTGSVSCEITAIGGQNIFYRITPEGATPGPFTAVSNATVRLQHGAFPEGVSKLDYYFEGNLAHAKTRTVVKSPKTFPSASESHGFLLTGDPSNELLTKRRKSIAPYSAKWNRWVQGTGDDAGRVAWESHYRTGRRLMPTGTIPNALLLRLLGKNAKESGQTKTYGRYALEMVLENSRNQDSVGWEMHWSGTALPCRPMVYRGYYDANTIFSTAYAYDIVAASYRSDQAPDGMTVIEDYFIRDSLANYVVECLMLSGTWDNPYDDALGGAPVTESQMWTTTRRCAAVVAIYALPSYSTPYYGTCGLDGNNTTYPWTPYPTKPITWKAALLDSTTPFDGYPNFNERLGVEENVCLPDGRFNDKVDYIAHVGAIFYKLLNTLKFADTNVVFPNCEKVLLNATQGTLYGTKTAANGSLGPAKALFLPIFNGQFPEIAKVGIELVRNPVVGETSDETLINGHEPSALAWYDVEYLQRPFPPVKLSITNSSPN